ncbi:galactosyltransferase or LPS biosynthesis rfbu related protein [Gloeomargarita lithophora Alchichica-D10]|uniref:Galactosyltransferase or LPS biosynthesis rfbu related protein n=1 Tax=Gloeomargarita lithophora Alchichica-D10 TaxID=1188229 RepID=A0A1J0A921_9CYAN|nr:glycosyltransferase [Gloeomargarita lithophora]APB32421.1 galactosyltransferase or LPS biosynthesis rfbu related protein [Gloeomargarita lithophora Alchichica-D10]
MTPPPHHEHHYRLAFLGGARYSYPLSVTHHKKFALLKNLGDIHVIGFAVSWRPQFFQEEASFYLLPNLPLPVLRYMQFFIINPMLLLWLVLRHKINIIIAQSPYEALAAVWVKNLVKLWGYSLYLVVESHGDFENYLFLQRQVFLPSLYKRIMESVAHITLSQADVLRSISHAIQAQLKRYAPDQPIVEFMAWTDISTFWTAGSYTNSKHLTVTYVGVLIPRKGVHHLINAFAQVIQQVTNSQLKIIGRPENPNYTQELKTQIEAYHLQDKVLFLPEIPQQELCHEIAQSIVLVLPSLSEGLGRVLIEAMAAGTPVIGTKVDGIPDIIQEDVTGFLVPPADENALAEKMIYLLENPEKALAMGQRGRKFVQNYFSPEIYYQGYEKICQLCLQSNL